MKNVVFEKDQELLKLFCRYGEYQRAQLLQDLAYLKFFDYTAADGYFVEVGVGDGQHVSNTYFFEKQFGWNGLLVEPNPAFHAAIRKQRKAKLDGRAAFSRSAESVDFQVCGELSRLDEAGYSDQHVRQGGKINISTATLTQILLESAAPPEINYLSIDTEGSEIDVLKGLDFTRFRVNFLTIEHNYVAAKRLKIREHLTSLGYICVSNEASLWDDWYIPETTAKERFEVGSCH